MGESFHLKHIVSRDSLPVRERGELLPSRASLYPQGSIAVYAETDPGDEILEVAFEISDLPSGGRDAHQYSLSGKIPGSEEVLFSSRTDTVLDNELTFSVAINKKPKGFLYFDEVVQWEISTSAPEADSSIETTTGIALYFLPRLPINAFQGVPLEALRLTDQALTGESENGTAITEESLCRVNLGDPSSDIAAIADWMFTRPIKAKYDTWQGASHFISTTSGDWKNNIILHYGGFSGILNADGSQLCNCFDMAAFLQYQIQYSVGAQVNFSFIEPFGYLKKTSLIGRGPCNNPFFSDPVYNSEPVCDEKAKDRSGFANHAFAFLPNDNVVADTCAGPHTGDETKQQYLEAAIDLDTPEPPGVRPGTVDDIKDYVGVIAVTSSMRADSIRNHYNLLDFVRFVMPETPAFEREMRCFRKALDIRECPGIGRLESFHHELHSDFPLVIERSRWKGEGNRSVDLRTWVSSDSTEDALTQFLALGSNHHRTRPIFEKGPDHLGEACGKFEGEGFSRYLWLDRNMVFDLKTTDFLPEEAREVASWVHETVSQLTESLRKELLPTIDRVTTSSQRPTVGDTLQIEVECADPLKVFLEGNHPGLYVQEEQSRSFGFAARKRSSNRFRVSVVNPETLLSSKRDLLIEVD